MPTPNNAGGVRKSPVERPLKLHRIRRLTAADVLEQLGEPAIPVALGTVARADLDAVARRLFLVNRQITEADRHIDRLTDSLAAAGDDPPGQKTEQRDATI